MKTRLRFIFSILIFLFITQISCAQLQATFAYADGYNACGESNLTIALKNTSSDNIYPIIAEFQLNSTMLASTFSTSLPDSKIIMSVTGNKLKMVFDTVLTTTGLFDIQVKMTSVKPCELIGCGQFFSTTDTLSLKYNSKDVFFYNNAILGSPCLTYDETLFTNRLVSAFLGDTITRTIVLKNTGGGKFDGTLQLKDVFGPFVSVQTVYSTTPGTVVSSAGTTDDSTYIFKAKFSNIKNGDSIVLIERVIVSQCIKDDEGKSSIYINWSCNNALCNQVNPYPIIAQVLKNKKKPNVVITKTGLPESNCLGSKTKYIYSIKNEGARPATKLVFTLQSSDYDTYTYISKASLKLSDTSGLTISNSYQSTLNPNAVIEGTKTHTFDHSCIISDPLYTWVFDVESLMPGDSFLVEAEGFQCCPAEDTSNIELTFETWDLFLTYKDECQEEKFQAGSSPDLNNKLSLNQFYEPITTDMHDGQKATFEIFVNNFTTDFYRLTKNNRAFKIRIKLDTGLVYLPNTLKISSIYGYTLTPTTEQMLSGAGVDGYQDNYLEAFFILPDTFAIDPTFFARFMRNSSVLFDLQGKCPAKIPSSRFTQDLLLIPDRSCAPSCDILLSSVTTLISVHCPGCITPGWVANSHKAFRLNLGEQDNDNNRLPDNLVFTLADPSKIKSNRCIPGDTLQTELTAFFQDGDPFVGKNTTQLENYGAKSFHFNYSYLSNKITYGKLFQLNHIKVIISDIDSLAIPSGVDSVDLPLSCATKIPNPLDSAANAEFFFDLSLDTLHKYGIPGGYAYAPSDGIKIVCQYTILEPSSFYLSTPPATTDPWLERENASILLNSFENLLYLTGNRETATDKSRIDAGNSFEKDPNSLDSTMIYWCEGYGSASTIVGKRREVSFNIPYAVQCREPASFYVAINPSGGVFRNAFPFEYRNFITIDSVHATVPAGYKFVDWTISNTVQKPDGFLEFEACTRTDSLQNVNVSGPHISIPINPLYSRQTTYGDEPCLDKLVYGDETIMTKISFTILPDCDLPETKIDYPSPVLYYRVGPNKIKYADVAQTEVCDANNVCKMEDEIVSAQKVNANLKLSPVTNEIQLTKQSFCYPINLEETIGYNANYSFIRIKSLNHKVKAESLTNKETNQVYLPDANGTFHLDTTLAKSVYQYELCLSNVCGVLIAKDTLRLIYGHDCFDYPDSIFSNICKLDSIDHYVFPGSLQIGGIINGPDEIKMCEPFEIVTKYQVSGIGGVEKMVLRLANQSTTLQAATLTIGDANANILTAFEPATNVFDLKQAVHDIKPDGIKAGDEIKITLKFNTDCQYKGTSISCQAILVTSACDTLFGDSLHYVAPALTGYPTSDNKSIHAGFGELKNLGGKLDATISVINNSALATKNQTIVTFLLPQGFHYASMTSGNQPTQVTDTSIVWQMAPGMAANSTLTLRPLLNYTSVICDSISFQLLLGDVSVGCSGQACVQRDTAYAFKAGVTCYPCAPEITLSERCKELPVFNVISWQYPTLNYCPDDRTFIYKLYFARTYSGTYALLDSTQDKTYTHDSLQVYDGCYYVTVTDLLQNLTTKSSILCKSTCRDQFKCGDLFISNLVTRNKDGSNETFEITGAYTTLKVEIYNSWGSTVYKSDDYKNEWDAKGVSDGVYYYDIYIDGSNEKCIGWVYVIGNK